jgi:hypothetical protein
MTSALVINSHYLEHNIKYDVIGKKSVLFRFVGTAFVGGFQISPVLAEVYLKLRFGTSRNAVTQSEQICSCKGKKWLWWY